MSYELLIATLIIVKQLKGLWTFLLNLLLKLKKNLILAQYCGI